MSDIWITTVFETKSEIKISLVGPAQSCFIFLLYFFVICLPPEFLPVWGPTEPPDVPPTLGGALLCSFRALIRGCIQI